MSKENKGREFYVDLIDLQRCDRTLDLGEGSGCRVVYYPHRDDLYRLVKVIQYSEFEKCQAEAEKLKAKVEKMKNVISDEDLACADCVEAKAEGYTICGECSVE